MGRRIRGVAWFVLLVTPFAGCASSGGVAEDPVFAQRDVDVRPRLLHCGNYAEPPRITWPETDFVTVVVLVGSDGRVENVGAPQRVSGPADGNAVRLDDHLRDLARDLAGQCIFEPATLEGIPVATGSTVSFRLPY